MGMIILGILIPFAGTTIGAASVYFMRNGIRDHVKKGLLGFASGIMVAASVWSLLIPAMRISANLERLAFLPAVAGFFCGILFLMFLDGHVPQLQFETEKPEGISGTLKKTTMLVLAVTLHNIPEGFAVGLTFAIAASNSSITLASAFALALGIGLQNLPEGAAISLPLKQGGMSRTKAFVYGSLSGIVEPIAGVIAGFTIHIMQTILPVCLSFAAGAMMYVVVEELIPEAQLGKHSHVGTFGVLSGFVIMMLMDIFLG